MRIWLDDTRPMPDGFDLAVDNEFLLEVLISNGKVSHLSLDNDLGIGNGSGYGVACFIEKLAANGMLNPISWEIHTSNPAARKQIEQALHNAEKFWYGNIRS